MTQIDIADLDCVYLSYDEPQKEEFWIKIQNMVPWAKRVDGVKGSDSAHKAAAAASDTERFILIDGDNLPDAKFFNLTLDLPDDTWNSAVFRWRARNHINALMYGNGGISCWTREFVNNMRTHENSNGDENTQVEFCFDPLYWPMHDCYSVTYPNATPFQAWRAGFREGVKMCLDRGSRPSLSEFQDRIHRSNLDNLSIWHNVGADVENGQWAMAGARLGTYMTMLTEWDYREVQWFDFLDKKWETVQKQDVQSMLSQYGDSLSRLGMEIVNMTATQRKFFKHLYR